MAPIPKGVSAKASNKRGGKPVGKSSSSKSGPPSKSKIKKPTSSKPTATQQKTKSKTGGSLKKKPPHMRYTEKELKVPQLNGIVPTGVQKRVNAKKGKVFCDDKDQMNAILAVVMAEKEGNIESKMMRARQLEEVREARRKEAEERERQKKSGFEDRKQELRDAGKRSKGRRAEVAEAAGEEPEQKAPFKKPKKRVSFG
ncbi:60S ribosomal subunit assembly/export protein [Elasticomyces elasticus]|nr:60S ribosomal subunit assembly/export protein [Elasticomyces elasticus]